MDSSAQSSSYWLVFSSCLDSLQLSPVAGLINFVVTTPIGLINADCVHHYRWSIFGILNGTSKKKQARKNSEDTKSSMDYRDNDCEKVEALNRKVVEEENVEEDKFEFNRMKLSQTPRQSTI